LAKCPQFDATDTSQRSGSKIDALAFFISCTVVNLGVDAVDQDYLCQDISISIKEFARTASKLPALDGVGGLKYRERTAVEACESRTAR
jgi:hypothetical protein